MLGVCVCVWGGGGGGGVYTEKLNLCYVRCIEDATDVTCKDSEIQTPTLHLRQEYWPSLLQDAPAEVDKIT